MIEGQRSTNPLNTDSSVVAFISPQPPFPLLPPPPRFLPPFWFCFFVYSWSLHESDEKGSRTKAEKAVKNDGAGEKDRCEVEAKGKLEVVAVSDTGQVWRTITPLWAASFESCQPEPHACDKGWGGGGDRSSRVLSLLQEKREHEINRKMGLKTFGLKSLTFYFRDWLAFPL